MEAKSNSFVYAINLFHFICWAHIFVGGLLYTISLHYPIMNTDKILSILLIILKITQTLQYSDTILSFLKLTKGSGFSSFIQITGRNYIIWFILSPKISTLTLVLIFLNWSFADSVRYLYYLSPNRFSLFLR